nr:selenium cofactor biosynthesis protein YqeC [uncultured Butyricicoccus sp.]
MRSAKKIAILGAGGKTTALTALAQQHRAARVLLTTTTHILPVHPPVCDRLCIDPDAQTLLEALSQPGITCAGMKAQAGKLSALPPDLLAQACACCDWLFYEADGAKHLPLKLHAPHEPVILPDTTHGIIVAGLSALGKPLAQAVHRYTLRPDWAQTPMRLVDADIVLNCVLDAVQCSGLPTTQLTVLLNQADTPAQVQAAQPILAALHAQGIAAYPAQLAKNCDVLTAICP